MYAIPDTDSNVEPGIIDTGISSVKNAATSVVNGVEGFASEVVGLGAQGVGYVADHLPASPLSQISAIGGNVSTSIKWLAIGLVAVGGIYLLLTYRQSTGRVA